MKNTSVLDIYGGMRLIDCVKDYTFTSQDYFVHMLRFTKMCGQLKDCNILDLGCGRYTNLLKAITQMSRGPHFRHYCGVDYGKIEEYRPDYKPVASKTNYFEYIDWTDDEDVATVTKWLEENYGGQPFVIVCFEVLEHMDFESQKKFLYNLSKLMHNPKLSDCVCYFSTPNFNGNAAKNHISEINYALEEELFARFKLEVTAYQGLSAWKRYQKYENLSDTFKKNISDDLLGYLTFSLPDPLSKMIWGALLHRRYSNNIMYRLEVKKDTPLFSMETCLQTPLKYAEYRQGGNCSLFCKDAQVDIE